jgi:uncharacterized protein with PQ loop repeat
MINFHDIIGYIGVFFISINLIPQIYHIYKIKNSEAISCIFIFIGLLSSFFMGLYGILENKNPIIISNSIMFCFYCILLVTKFYYTSSYFNIPSTIKIQNNTNEEINQIDKISF